MADFSAAERRRLAAEGVAMEDGSYPIRNATDLRNAHMDYVRTGRDASVAAHIRQRAKALRLADPLDEMSTARAFAARKRI